MRSDFAVFILTHGRPNRVLTIKSLQKCGYTGKIYLIVDNKDKSLDDYRRLCNDTIDMVVFDKDDVECDTCDNIDKKNIVLYARNNCHNIAKDLGLTYFLELDDDYSEFRSRMLIDGKLCTIYVRDFDSIVDRVIEFIDNSGAHTVAFAQTGDFIGGAGSRVFKERLARKAMNSFFCKTDRPFKFYGRINEDVNAYVLNGSRGELYFTIADVSLDQCTTQAHSGGLTESYLEMGTYVKSFYTVICCPSSVKVHVMGCSHKRIHHSIDWEHAVPKIISSDFKKEENRNENHTQNRETSGIGIKSNKGLF